MSGRQVGAVVGALVGLAVLAGSPGAGLGQGLAGGVGAVLGPGGGAPASAAAGGAWVGGPWVGASPAALADIPPAYLGWYVTAAEQACAGLAWQVLAAVGKVESDHGRSRAPGVHAGVNRHGCCAGPMQFNLTNGPPSTWQTWGTGRRADVYRPAAAIPAAARKLCHDGLAGAPRGRDPCPQVLGPAHLHRALKRYNNACWYVHEVVTIATRYTLAARPLPAAADPFVAALVAHPNLEATTAHGCQPLADLAAGRVDLRVQSLLAVLADRHRLRLSCLVSGHARRVAGSGRRSQHAVGRAVDIDRVDGRPVGPASGPARALVAWLDRLDGPLRPAEIGTPWPIGHPPFFTDPHHRNHLHIAYTSQ